MADVVLELLVNDHPGAMSHVTGLFTRRAYNVDRIHCSPLPGSAHSRVILVVRESERLAQLVVELRRLYDVLDVRVRDDWPPDAFARIDAIVGASSK